MCEMNDMSHVRGKGSAEFDSIRIGQRPSIEATCRLLPGIGAGIGGRDSCVTHRNCADDDRRRSLGDGRLRSYGAPSCFPTAIRNAGSSIILTDSMLIVRTLEGAAKVGARQ
jgi:hypothetical protein